MKSVSIFFSLFLATAVLAQSTSPASVTAAPPASVRDEIVVTASAIPETVEATPASVTVITRKEIEERGARDVIDVLREVPGVAMSQTGSSGKTASAFMRGASSKQTLVLWNGLEINDPYFSGYNFGQFSTIGVERIEIVRGPFSALYGADAVGGVINIITTGAKDRFAVDLSAGERGLMNGALSLSKTRGIVSFNVAAEHRQDDGFFRNDDDRQNSILGALTVTPRRWMSLGVAGRVVRYDLGIPFNTDAFATQYVPTPRHRQNGNEWQVAVPLMLDLAGVHVDARAAESRRDDDYADPDAFAFGTTVSSRRNAALTLRKSTAAGTVVIGGEAESIAAQNHDSYGLDLDSRHRSSHAVFVEDRYSRDLTSGRLELSAGVRRDIYATFGGQTSPRIGAGFATAAGRFRAAYGEAFRAPQIGELFLPFFGNPSLRPEHSRSAEVGYDRWLASGATLSATLFNARFRDLIVYDVVSSRFANVGQARSRGVELAASQRFGSLTANVSYTYLRATDESTGEQLTRRPRHSGSIALAYEVGAATAELTVGRVGARPDIREISPFGNVTSPAYTVANIALRWDAGVLSPYVRVENLTNTRYQEVFGYPSPTRRAIAGVRYSFEP